MANPYVGAQVWHASIIIPSDGDPAVAESVNIALRDLMDDAAVLRTDIAHQAADDRGITSTITGDIIWNDGGGSFESNIPSEFNGGLDLSGNPLTIHSSSSLECNGPAEFDGNVTVGNTGTDQLNVNSRADFFGGAHFWQEQVNIHSTSGIDCSGPAVFDGPTTTIQSPLNQIGLDEDSSTSVAGTLTVSRNAVVGGQLITLGNSTLGNSATDAHTVNGDLTCEDSLTVREDLSVEGNLTVDGDISLDDLTCQDITIQGDAVIGNNSASDTLTINALLAAPLGFTSAGRVPQRPTAGPDANASISVTSTNLVTVGFGGLSATRTYTLGNGTVDGDEMLISTKDTTYLLVVDAGADAASIQAAGPTSPAWLRYVWLSGSWRLVERGP